MNGEKRLIHHDQKVWSKDAGLPMLVSWVPSSRRIAGAILNRISRHVERGNLIRVSARSSSSVRKTNSLMGIRCPKKQMPATERERETGQVPDNLLDKPTWDR